MSCVLIFRTMSGYVLLIIFRDWHQDAGCACLRIMSRCVQGVSRGSSEHPLDTSGHNGWICPDVFRVSGGSSWVTCVCVRIMSSVSRGCPEDFGWLYPDVSRVSGGSWVCMFKDHVQCVQGVSRGFWVIISRCVQGVRRILGVYV